jgi:hypothetical protein
MPGTRRVDKQPGQEPKQPQEEAQEAKADEEAVLRFPRFACYVSGYSCDKRHESKRITLLHAARDH